MDFGAWVQSMRSRRGMDVRAFAHLVGVDASTISRVERARSQVTVATMVRIGEGIGTTPVELLTALRGKRPTWAYQCQKTPSSEVMTITDVQAWLSSLRRSWQEECIHLAYLLNQIAAYSDERSTPPGEITLLIVPEDIEKLLADSRLYQFKVHYPEDMSTDAIWDIYVQGGALSLVDIGAYIRQARRIRRVTLSGLEESGKLSVSVLSRLEAGALERVKLMDVLTLDEQLKQEGRITAMYWRTCVLIDALTQMRKRDEQTGVPMPAAMDRIEQDLKMSEVFLTICRWLSCLSPTDHVWVTEFRQRFQGDMKETSLKKVEDEITNQSVV